MLDLEDARRQQVGGIVFFHRHRRLHDDRSGVELAGDEVHGGAGDLDAVLERLTRASTPGNAGSSDGCTFSMRSPKASRKVRPSSRMKPARQTSDTSRARSSRDERRLERLAGR